MHHHMNIDFIAYLQTLYWTWKHCKKSQIQQLKHRNNDETTKNARDNVEINNNYWHNYGIVYSIRFAVDGSRSDCWSSASWPLDSES